MIVSCTDEGNQALQEFLMACNPKQQVFIIITITIINMTIFVNMTTIIIINMTIIIINMTIIIILFLQHSTALESYLIKPIQRILKYPLLLTQLKVFLIKKVIMMMVRR